MISRALTRTGTYADVEAAPAGLVAELVDGALMVGPRPRTRHTIVATGVAIDLGDWWARV